MMNDSHAHGGTGLVEVPVPPSGRNEPATADLRDPVCGMRVTADSPLSYTHGGKTYHFCSAQCLEKFKAEPARYQRETPEPKTSEKATPDTVYTCPMHPEVRQKGPGACPQCGMALEPAGIPTPATRIEYTCPMHPEIVRDAPGHCPICGMALEPRTVSLAEEENIELKDMTRRFWLSTVLTLPLILMAMSHLLPGQPLVHLASPRTWRWLELLLATPVVLWGGWPFFVRGGYSVVNRHLNMFTLIALGVGVAYLYSVIAALFPGLFPASFRDAHGEVGVYFEAAAVIVTLVLLGQVMELRARSRTSAAVRALLKLAPKTARRLRPDGIEEDVPLDWIQPGERLRVRPGENVPVDGVVLEGTSGLSCSLLGAGRRC